MDEELRALHRTGAGSPEEEARALKAALRAGRLDARRVRAAAYLGHAPSRAAVGEDAPAGDDWLDREGWVRVAYHPAAEAVRLLAGRLTQLRGGAAGCHKAPHEYEAPCHALLEAARAWLLEPGPATAQAARDRVHTAGQALDVTYRPTRDNPSGAPPEDEAYSACSAATVVIWSPEVEAPVDRARRLALIAEIREADALCMARGRRPLPAEPVAPDTVPFIARRSVRNSHAALRRVLGYEDRAARRALREALVRGVVPWLLGQPDPVRVELIGGPRGRTSSDESAG